MCRLAYPDGHVGWLITSHDLARSILGERRLTINRSMDRPPVENNVRRIAFDRLEREGNRRVASGYAGNFLNMDPPEHTRFRRMLAGEFSLRKMQALRPQIREIVNECIHEWSAPPIDLVDQFAQPVPSRVISEILGVPHDVRDHFEAWSTILEDPRTPPDELADAYHEFTEFMYGLVENPGSLPGDSLIARLASAGELNHDELVGVGVLLVAAGHQTVANMIAFSVYTLLTDRALWDSIAVRPDSISGAVEELLRYLTIFQLGALTRTATEDIEVAGEVIRAGESITVSLSAANRDPKVFADSDHLDFERSAGGHVAFGHGIHVCLGQHLARIELEESLVGLIRIFPDMHLAVRPEDVPMHPGYEGQAGPETLMVRW